MKSAPRNYVADKKKMEIVQEERELLPTEYKDWCEIPDSEKEDHIIELGDGQIKGDQDLGKMEKCDSEEAKKWDVKPHEIPIIEKMLKDFAGLDWEQAVSCYCWAKNFPDQVEDWIDGKLEMKDTNVKTYEPSDKPIEIKTCKVYDDADQHRKKGKANQNIRKIRKIKAQQEGKGVKKIKV